MANTIAGMHFTTRGAGQPILFIHGWTTAGAVEANDFEPVFADVATTPFERIYLDLPGMGSSPAAGIQSLDDILARLEAFVTEYLVPRGPFLLVGTSCGAYLARALAWTFPDFVAGLLLRVPLVQPESMKRDLPSQGVAVADPALMASLSATEQARLGDVPVQTPRYLALLRQRLESVIFPAVAQADHTVLGPIREDPNRYVLRALVHTPLQPFRRPTLILTGRQDMDVGFRDAWNQLLDGYPRATFVALDRAGHGLPVDDERLLFMALVRDWLRRVVEEEPSVKGGVRSS